jgi:hypothetical protein
MMTAITLHRDGQKIEIEYEFTPSWACLAESHDEEIELLLPEGVAITDDEAEALCLRIIDRENGGAWDQEQVRRMEDAP